MALTSPASAADKKLDILGFFPGMAADTFKDRLAALHCDADLCKFDGRVLQVIRSADASIRLVACPGAPDTIAEALTHDLPPRSAIRKHTALVARLFELW